MCLFGSHITLQHLKEILRSTVGCWLSHLNIARWLHWTGPWLISSCRPGWSRFNRLNTGVANLQKVVSTVWNVCLLWLRLVRCCYNIHCGLTYFRSSYEISVWKVLFTFPFIFHSCPLYSARKATRFYFSVIFSFLVTFLTIQVRCFFFYFSHM